MLLVGKVLEKQQIYTWLQKKLSEDKRNLVCIIKPDSYDVQGIVRLSKSIKEKDQKGYLSESLWKFLIYSEIALAAYKKIKMLPYVDKDTPEDKLEKLMENQGSMFLDEFAVRLERAVNSLSFNADHDSLYDYRTAISEILHARVLRILREILGKILTTKKHVIVLMDNLDKSWDKKEDLNYLSYFLFGLLNVAREITKEFAKKDHWRKPVNVSITIFLRSDIFERVMKNAREPDKISCDKLHWEDPEVLIRIIEERLSASREIADPGHIWEEVFCPTVKNESSRKYILDVVLPRPRDLVYFIKAALSVAINRGHDRIQEEDIIEAEKQYSQFVFEVIQVENGVSLPELETILFEFVGGKTTLEKSEILDIFSKSKISKDLHNDALLHLITLSFLGVETDRNKFRFCNNINDLNKIIKLSERFISTENFTQKYQIHKAFHAYLEVS